jgi:hypothetical protein
MVDVRLDKSAHAARAAEHREITAAALAREGERSAVVYSLSTDGDLAEFGRRRWRQKARPRRREVKA